MESILKSWGTWGVIILAAITYVVAPIIRNYISLRFELKKNHTFRRQKLFEEYSKRYCYLISSLIESTSSFQNNFDKNKPQQRRYALEFFMLISEEFFLQEEKLIDERIWNIWDQGVDFHLKKNFFMTAWNYCQNEVDFDGKFSEYVNSKIEPCYLKHSA